MRLPTLILVVLLLHLAVTLIHSAPAKLQVNTDQGKYEGFLFPNGARAFLGIPFAKAPLGDLRWTRALPAENFTGVRDAKESGPCCPQSGIFKNLTVKENEDCLTLDIYTPRTVIGKLPVKVYIHGGGFAANSAALYPGDELAVQSSSVVVVINYRLSYQGFMVFSPLLEEDNYVVNYGLTDQQVALRWIQQNIKRFGGDKKNVLIFGNSAGGMSVLMHYTLESSKDLFKAGVSQSAGPWNYMTAQTAARINDPLAARFGCYDSSAAQPVNITCLRAVPITALYSFTWATAQPVYDALIPQPIATALGSRAVMEKAKGGTPLVLGHANYEGNQFAYLGLRFLTKNPSPPLFATFPLYFGILNASLPYSSADVQKIANYYASLSVNGNYYIPLREALGDYGIKCGNIRAAQNALEGLDANVYNYYFNHDTSKWRFSFLNATHTVEIPYVFLSNGTVAETKFTAEETQLASDIVTYLSNFQNEFDPNGSPLPNWPTFKKDADSTLAWDFAFPVIKLPVPSSCPAIWNSLTVDQASPRRLGLKSNFAKFVNDRSATGLFHG